eukprot:CAMPEP_0113947828 /NCGR_PEP_ID=MMETSP1339-20121228/66891_1 /TAXON_ID=94617 /ORGANISM="Fibrocapsa japonica" /LENGTH=132 /DNA_ID=CAMNT_0000954579 /DNA_START=45 /DNA_END=443 /DNA_ORIENTATION=- /assembly_acc=CAM_ASM_000762
MGDTNTPPTRGGSDAGGWESSSDEDRHRVLNLPEEDFTDYPLYKLPPPPQREDHRKEGDDRAKAKVYVGGREPSFGMHDTTIAIRASEKYANTRLPRGKGRIPAHILELLTAQGYWFRDDDSDFSDDEGFYT